MEVKNQWKGWLYLAPALILLAVFTFYPFFRTIFTAFMGSYTGEMVKTVDGALVPELVGYDPLKTQGWNWTLNNFYYGRFVEIFGDNGYEWKWTVTGVFGSKDFGQALLNTAVIAVVTVPGSTIIALLMSVALNSIRPLQKFLQTIYFLPYVTNSIAIGMVFAVMFDMSTQGVRYDGLINNFLSIFGIPARGWVELDATWGAKMTVACVYGIWNALPFKIMILLGALQSVNKQYYDAAKVDCASRFRTFWKITVPMLSPMISYVLITGFIGAFKEYSSLIGLFGDDLSLYKMNTIVGLVYESLETNNYGLASSYAIALFGIILVFTLINLYVSNKRVHY